MPIMTFKQMAVVSLNLMFAAAVAPTTARAEGSAPPEYQVKAAYLFNFAKFVEWPAWAFESDTSPLVIGVLGNGAFLHDLESTIQNKKINNHPVIVRTVESASEFKSCHILFLSDAEKRRWGEIQNTLADAPVLTVSENNDRFLAEGGMINFVLEQKMVRFEISNANAKKAGLQISSKLLALSRHKPEP